MKLPNIDFQELSKSILASDFAETGIIILSNDLEIQFANEQASAIINSTTHNLKKLEKQKLDAVLDLYDSAGSPLAYRRLPVQKIINGGKQSSPFFCCIKTDQDFEPIVLKFFSILGFLFLKIRVASRDATLESMKNNFMSFAAHQLKTPSSVVKGYLELAMKNPSGNTENQKYIYEAYLANEQLITRSHQLLNSARLDGALVEPRYDKVNITELVDERMKFYEPWAKKNNITINFTNRNASRAYPNSDASIIKELLDILLNNALKFSPQDSEILIEFSDGKKEYPFELHIHDEGEGLDFDSQNLPKKDIDYSDILFNNKSYGVGLKLAHKFAKLINAKIILSNRDDGRRGARASIYLP